ncbi:hypothetical protein ACLUWY_03510, partial [Limosilactobacillus mucosae]
KLPFQTSNFVSLTSCQLPVKNFLLTFLSKSAKSDESQAINNSSPRQRYITIQVVSIFVNTFLKLFQKHLALNTMPSLATKLSLARDLQK